MIFVSEQWKRIAGRKAQNSPPLSRQYYQSMGTMVDLPQAEIPQQLGSYRRPGRSDEETTDAGRTRNLWRLTHRRFFTGSSVVVVLLAVALAIILAFALSKTIQFSFNFEENLLGFSQLVAPVRCRPNIIKARFTSTVDSKRRFKFHRQLCQEIIDVNFVHW